MNIIEQALAIALKAHTGQTDKAGKTYILHPLRVMLRLQSENEMATAILHDTVEDSELTPADLRAAGIPEEVVAAVECLTKGEGESYDHFLQRVLTNDLASRVKQADIEDNMDLYRLPSLHEKDLARLAKYHAAWQLLHEKNR